MQEKKLQWESPDLEGLTFSDTESGIYPFMTEDGFYSTVSS